MRETKLSISFEPLWEEDPIRFVLRYRDISESHQTKLAQSIKTNSTIETLRKVTGPTIEKIQDALFEINPIIFAEGMPVRWSTPYSQSTSRYIAGWYFKMLCQGLYKMLCRKRKLTRTEIERLAQLTCQDWNKINILISTRIQQQSQAMSQARSNPNYQEIGIQEIANIARGVLTPQVPLEMREWTPSEPLF